MRIIVAQIIGFIGLICTITSIQQNKKNKVLIFQILANLLYFLQYFLLGALAGASISFLAIFRCYMFYQYDKNKKNKSLLILIIFVLLIILFGICSYDDIFSLIPIITAIMYSYGVWQNNLKRFRIIALIVPMCWFIYNIYVSAYIGMIATILEFISALVAIIRLDILKINK